jgi:hypothetical protein
MNRKGFASIIILFVVLILFAVVAALIWYHFSSRTNLTGTTATAFTYPTDFTLINLDNEYTVELPTIYTQGRIFSIHATSTPESFFENNGLGLGSFEITIDPYIASNINPFVHSGSSYERQPCSASPDSQSVYCERLALTDSFTTADGKKIFYSTQTSEIKVPAGESMMGRVGPSDNVIDSYEFAVPDKANGHIVEFSIHEMDYGDGTIQELVDALEKISIPSLQPITKNSS